jgi:CspA family cold shock protein
MGMIIEEEHSGVVKTFDPFKGFGFITRKKGKDVFFFYEDIAEDSHLFAGAPVSFIIKKGAKGPRAYNIKKIK